MEINKNICSLCYANNVRVIIIENTRLQNICEILTSHKIQSDSHQICYICYKRFLQCEQLVKQIQELKAEYNQSQEKPLLRLSAKREYTEVPPEEVYRFYVPIIKQEQEKECYDVDAKLLKCESDRPSTSLSKYCIDIKVEPVTSSESDKPCVNQHDSKPQTQQDMPYGSCDICNEKFTLYSNLRRHIEKHLGVNCIACEVCNKKFTRNCDLNKHMKVHTDVEVFGCDACGKIFTRNCYLKKHVKINHDVKVFSCDVCSKKFTYQCNLNEHRKIHSGLKPFGCTICGKNFLTKGNLKTHIETHSLSEKPFSCSVCGKSFTKEIYLMKHIKRHSAEQPFSCVVCSKKYKKKQDLVKHTKTHENAVSE